LIKKKKIVHYLSISIILDFFEAVF
jgi:hypothetical protein